MLVQSCCGQERWLPQWKPSRWRGAKWLFSASSEHPVKIISGLFEQMPPGQTLSCHLEPLVLEGFDLDWVAAIQGVISARDSTVPLSEHLNSQLLLLLVES